MSVLNNIDIYKADHRNQYPKGTTQVMSNWTPRSSRLKGIDKVVLFGLQYYIKRYLIEEWNNTFFSQDKATVVAAYARRMKNCGINITFEHIEELHDLGHLPIQIDALPEGASVPIGCPMFTIRNTHSSFFWLTNYLETSLSNTIWQACTSATIAKEYRKIFTKAIKDSGGLEAFVDFMGHDFSYRGMSSQESAAISGAAHLLSFKGTDTIPAIDFLETYYNANSDRELIGCSVPATEHSVMCMGSKESEYDTFKRLITETYPSGIVSIVSDTWDYWKVWTDIIPKLKDDIVMRTNLSSNPMTKVVIRPDSGDPVKIICGEDYETYDTLDEAKEYVKDDLHDVASEDCEGSHNFGDESYFSIVKVKEDNKFYKITVNFEYNRHDKTYYFIEEYSISSVEEYVPTPEFLGSFDLAWNLFGGGINEKGFRELAPCIGLIYGDSITLERADQICKQLIKKGYVPSMVFGIGSYTYQYNTRDTFGFAIKSTFGEINGVSREIFKEPKTDNGVKKSAKGITGVFKNEAGEYYLKDQIDFQEYNTCELKPVFYNGNLIYGNTLEGIRGRI